ncbi:MAG: hypothetical protein KJZ78_09905 [Bryobacteraceae bacterium]|nr:hypothetical protein [Bryobacteraceae bacterium]
MALLPFSSSSHLPDGTLLRLHDGELDAVARRRAQKHLLHCWHCRSRAERLSTTVHTFVGYCDSVFAELRDGRVALTRSAEALRAELHREAAKPDAARRSVDRWVIFRQGWAHLSRPQVSTSLVATLLVGWWLFLGDAAPRAQASELLERAASGEARRLGSVASTPLIHQTLEVRCDAQRAEWEMWHAPALPDRRETVSAPEEEALSIHVQGRNPGDGLRVTAASITLTGKDLHPVAQSLEVSEPGGRTASTYRIREVSLTVMPFDKAPAGLFEETHRAAGKKHAPGVEPFSSLRLTPTAAQLEETEARLREVLHKTGLQARLAPRIKVEDRMVIVQAIVEDREQKTRMLSAIGGIPFVRPQIWEPDDSPAAAVTVFEITGGQARQRVEGVLRIDRAGE